mmetsp:Transcript_10206/g.15315  ORF Transcript_10206/g.15315 Transcript_10206/m.15315 type:complete len:444 (-) Transcript_10206:1295-2626(-)
MFYSKTILASEVSSSTPLYVLGAGSIGLLHAASMTQAGTKVKHALKPCLLLRSHHKSKVKKSFRHEMNFPKNFALSRKSLGSRECLNHDIKTISNSLICNGFEEGENHGSKSGGESIIVAFKNRNGEISILDVPARIINESKSKIYSERDYIQHVLLCTKAPDAVTALESILYLCHPTKRVKVIVMTNGVMAVVSEIEEMLMGYGISDRIDIILASTTHGAHRGDDNDTDFEAINEMTNNLSFNVHFAGLGHTFLEEDEFSSVLSGVWNDVGLRSHVVSSDEINLINWKKLAANCAINPLTALRVCKNGNLLNAESQNMVSIEHLDQHEKVWKYDDPMIFYQLIREVSDVALAKAKKNGLRDESLRESFQYDKLVDFVQDVVSDTENNTSSMLQDVLGRRTTEIRYLNGYIANLGREDLGVGVVANDFVTREVENLTNTLEIQ